MKNHPTLFRIGRTLLIFLAIVIANGIIIAVVELSFRYPILGVSLWSSLVLGFCWWLAGGRDK